jgi:hypothetical protein
MAEQLTNFIMEVHKKFSAGDALGIDFEKKAFYDILKELCIKYDFKYPKPCMWRFLNRRRILRKTARKRYSEKLAKIL